MDWTRSGRRDTFKYVRVKFPEFTEADVLDGITSCSIEESAFTTLKVSGKIGFEEVPEWAHNIGDDLIRVYSTSKLGDDVETVCHGTMFTTSSSGSITGKRRSAEYSLYSTLKVFQDELTTEAITIPAGTNVVDWIVKEIKARSLPTSATPSTSWLQAPMTFEFGTEYVKVFNGLLSAINYRSLFVDAYGTICLAPKLALEQQTPACTFSDTDPSLSVSAATFESDFDTSSIPNHVVVISETQDGESMRAEAVNNDINSPWSIPSRKRKITRCEKVDKVANQQTLQAKADELLQTSMLKVEKVTIEHLWQPLEILDAVSFEYSKSNMVGKFSATKRTREMRPGIPCKTTLRRFIQLSNER